MRAVLEHEGDAGYEEMLASVPDLSGNEPSILDLYFRLRRATASDQPVSIDQALTLHRIYLGDPIDAVAFLEEIDAMDAEFSQARGGEAERRQAEAKAREKAKERA